MYRLTAFRRTCCWTLVPLCLIVLFPTGVRAQVTDAQREVLNEYYSLLSLYQKSTNDEEHAKALDYTDRMISLWTTNTAPKRNFVWSSHDFRGRALFRLERYEESIASLWTSLKFLGRDPARTEADIVAVLEYLADAYYYKKDYKSAAPHFQRVVKQHQAIRGASDEITQYNRRQLANCNFFLKDYAAAETIYRQGMAAARTVGADNPNVAVWLHDLGDCRWNQGDKPFAVTCYTEAFELRQSVLGALDEATLKSREDAIDGLLKLGRLPAAEALIQKTISHCEANSPGDSAEAVLHLAKFYQEHRRTIDLEPLLLRAIKLQEKALGSDHPDLADTLHEVAWIYETQGKYRDAERYHRRGLTLREKHAEADNTDLANSRYFLAQTLILFSHTPEAETLLRQSLATYEKQIGPDSEETADALLALGQLYYQMGRYSESDVALQRVLTIQESRLKADDPGFVQPLMAVAWLRVAQGRNADAETAIRRTLVIAEEHHGSENIADTELAFVLDALGSVLQDQGSLDEAQKLHQQAVQLAKEKLHGMHPWLAPLINNLAAVHGEREEWTAAEDLYTEALLIWQHESGAEEIPMWPSPCTISPHA
ncbi:MAG: tetratricopeptide repeat protein, partial [Planctomycetota bacterium]|nr:tetratricopeptide repeat protein [Planctomycetota bacterium]